MMWDLGGQAYIPGTSPPLQGYPPQQSSYPAYPQEPVPFAPTMGQPMPQAVPMDYSTSYGSDSSYSSSPSGAISRAISDPGNVVVESTRSAPVVHSFSSNGERVMHIHVHSGHHHHHHSEHHRQPQRSSHAQAQPTPHRLTHQPPPAQPHASHSSQPHRHGIVWGYSKCTGRKKALCIGINYTGTKQELRGCVNDAKNMRNFLIRSWGYKAEDIVLLTDDASNPRAIPTRRNMLDAMRWLVKDAHQHDSLFFHYSGHGSQVKDRDGDEVDGYDEVILPVDFARAGYISDDLLHQTMVHPLPLGCRLTALFDSCHSGSVLDLPYLYHSDGRIKGSQVSAAFIEAKSTPADVISFSGCQDNQTSADTYAAGGAVGAMSHAFIQSFTQNPHQTYQQLLRSVRKILHDKYHQKPQLSTSHHIDTNLQFIL